MDTSADESGAGVSRPAPGVLEAIEAADYGYVLEAGRVVLEGKHDALSANDRVRQAYLGM